MSEMDDINLKMLFIMFNSFLIKYLINKGIFLISRNDDIN